MNGSGRGKFSNDQETSTMSSKAKPYIIGAALGASTMFFALQYHVVHSHDGFQIIPRTPQQSIGLAYADVRSWSPSQWTDRPELARALMAHGSSDLIAESVASTLADTVSEDSQGLDELRSFLNETRTKVEEGADDLLNIPRDENTSDASDPANTARSRSSEVVGIPYPKDATNKPLADPFGKPADEQDSTEPGTMAGIKRSTDVASRAEVPVKNNPTNTGGSRFTADDVVNGFGEMEDPRPAKVPSSSRKTGNTSKGASVLEQAKQTEDLIFGKDSPVGSGSTSGKSSSSRPAAKPVEPPSEAESMFEEVTSQLENRAQDALNRAQETAKVRVTSAADEATKTGSAFMRNKAEQMLPEAAKSIINNAVPSTTTEGASSGTFDPFLE